MLKCSCCVLMLWLGLGNKKKAEVMERLDLKCLIFGWFISRISGKNNSLLPQRKLEMFRYTLSQISSCVLAYK